MREKFAMVTHARYAPDRRKGSAAPEPVRAAEYVPMSTGMQVFSPIDQRAAIKTFCAQRGWELVRSYHDDGKSGLTLHRREGLSRLLADVLSGNHDFSKLIVYDISRWGRF